MERKCTLVYEQKNGKSRRGITTAAHRSNPQGALHEEEHGKDVENRGYRAFSSLVAHQCSWLQRLVFDRVHQPVLQVVANEVRESKSILDVDCGTGRLLRAARTLWPHAQLIGVDPAESMIEVARHLAPGITFSVGLAEALSLPDASVEVVLSTLSFHNWSDQAAAICEVARVLRPGGRFFLADAIAPAWLSRLIHHARFHSRGQLRTLFTEAGLQVIAQQPLLWRFIPVTVGVDEELVEL